MICKTCKSTHDGKFGSGIFCSRSCANSRGPRTEEFKEKVRAKLKKPRKHCLVCEKELNGGTIGDYCFDHFRNDDYRKKLSESVKGKVGGYRKGSGRGKSGWYKEFWCDSSWELAFVIYNIEHNIKFERNVNAYPYVYLNKQRKYYPDFILDDGTIVEIKGYDTKQSNMKHRGIPNLIILRKKEIKKYIDYAIKQYGKNFITLYE